ncbi:ABC transporter permease [Klebsiella quasipneumoniae]|uniref:ABC transporter permease n=1 Tax=Klebsiella quasipneumoniae TaxID=1463165 RepID=UPI0031F30893
MTLLLATFHWLTQPEHWLGDEGILLRLGQHLYYVLVSMAVACAIALPLGIALGYWRKGAFVVINLFNLGRAIPSLGLILLCIIVFGFNDIPVLAAPLILAGVRTALVQLIATAVVAAYAGLGGLGRFLIDGLGQRDIPQVIGGSLVVSLLAIGGELLFARCAGRLVHRRIAAPY